MLYFSFSYWIVWTQYGTSTQARRAVEDSDRSNQEDRWVRASAAALGTDAGGTKKRQLTKQLSGGNGHE